MRHRKSYEKIKAKLPEWGFELDEGSDENAFVAGGSGKKSRLLKLHRVDGATLFMLDAQTIHGTKGKEWMHVCMFDFKPSEDSEEEMLSDCHIAYVGITRAELRLLITGPRRAKCFNKIE